ncbi:uncharacterized protein LOC126266273 isoform X2 [Aethina tumida]|uniref:uncharacterized protein LOC126266273 isoform X2 n=1 Tax=Aethina tumida TaxID=116153 RepID=UPI002148D650|nr:uncharacterized protein LOC126266273 isoform X2 [Aethina tumida]
MSKLLHLLFLVVVLCFIGANTASTANRSERSLFPFMRYGVKCNGCPANFCDDDPSIIHGYCCGCARFYDNLPVKCSSALRCPLNTYELCDKYEYMMSCCCSRKK